MAGHPGFRESATTRMRIDRSTAPLLVLGGVVSVQFGAALAATLVPRIGAVGSVLLRLSFATIILCAFARPRLRGRPPRAWATVVVFGLALAAMNAAFYSSLAYLPIGVAVTVEFLGPLTLAAVLSRRPRDIVAVLAAGLGVALVSGATGATWDRFEPIGLFWALVAGAMWAAYIMLSQRTGTLFTGLDGLALALVVSTAVVAPFGLASVDAWTPEIVGLGLGIAVLSTVLPYSLELMALRHLSQSVFGILLSLEPAVAALAGLLVLDQVLDRGQVLGLLLVVVASALVLSAKTKPDPPDAVVGPG